MSKSSVLDPAAAGDDAGGNGAQRTSSQPATQSTQHASTQPPTSDSNGSAAVDNAQSLRDAALRTLKAKRKRSPGHTQNLPTAPSRMRPTANIATPSIQLDYGNNESTTIPPKPSAQLPKSTPSPQLSSVVDSVSREEGEISDSESTPTLPAKPLDSPLETRPFRPSRHIAPVKPPTPVITRDVNLATGIVNVKPEPTSPVIIMGVSQPLLSSTSRSTPEIPGLSMPQYVVDEYHVRPGLSFTQEKYDRAKQLILDLLGLGVPPEYLMGCGITRELVYFTFTELGLRLPAGFDTAGIPQYSPEFLQSLFESQKPTEMPDPVSSASRVEEQPFQLVETTAGTPSGSTPATPATPASGSPSLLDIEQQRRRELLARKAVIASRKGKQPQTSIIRTPSPHSANVFSVHTPFKDVEMSSAEVAPGAAVDDFLNSIGPEKPAAARDHPPPPAESEFDGMDIDEIPGLGGIWAAEEADPPAVGTPVTPVPNSPLSPPLLPPDAFNSVEVSAGSLSSGESTPLLSGDGTAPQRLGTKRPVAADFVDAEKFQSHTYQLSFSNGQQQKYPPYAKRRPGGFAGITNTRRCVIDLSDSEDEEYPEDADAPPQPKVLPPSRHNSFNSHYTSNTPFKAINTPSSPGLNSFSNVTLLEKELEIKRMREMIARKEQMRLRKLISSRNTPTQSPTPNVSDAATPVPQEDIAPQSSDDIVMEDATTIEISRVVMENVDDVPGRAESPVVTSEYKDVTMELQQEPPIDTPEPHATHDGAAGSSAPVLEVDDAVPGLNTGPSSTQQEYASESGQEVLDSGLNPAEDATSEKAVSSGFGKRWTAYQSPLQSYPLSRWHLHLTGSDGVINGSMTSVVGGNSILTSSGSFSSNSADGSPPADFKDTTAAGNLLRSLKMVTLFKNLDPDRRICQFEIPGGGVCRDDKCEDLHIEKELEIWEPSDNDTAQYLSEALVTSKQDQRPRTPTDVKEALEETRTRQETKGLGFEDRISAALSILGVLGH